MKEKNKYKGHHTRSRAKDHGILQYRMRRAILRNHLKKAP